MSDGTVLDTVDSDRLAENSYRQMVDYLENILERESGLLIRIVGPEVCSPPYMHPRDFHE